MVPVKGFFFFLDLRILRCLSKYFLKKRKYIDVLERHILKIYMQ
jgi:hypothetical protein